MNKSRINNGGLSAIYVLIILIVVIVIGIVGYLVFHKNKTPLYGSSTTNLNQAPVSVNATNWQKLKDSYGKLEVSYPPLWTINEQTPKNFCDGSEEIYIYAPTGLITSAASTSVNGSSFSQYLISIEKFGNQKHTCPADGSNFIGTNYSVVNSLAKTSSGLFSGNYVTFFGPQTTDVNSNGLGDSFVLTSNSYTKGPFSSDTIKVDGSTYQVEIQTSEYKEAQTLVPVPLNITKFTSTELYKDSLEILNSISSY